MPNKGTLLVDALLGTGIEDTLRGPVAEIIQFFRAFQGTTLAIDLPSGLSANTGHVINEPIPADCTVTFQLPKICHRVFPAADSCGKVEVLDIGIWPAVVASLGIVRREITSEWVRESSPARTRSGHKGSYGHVLAVGGSAHYAGAIALVSHAALRTGAGLSTAFCPEIAREAIHSLGPEVMVFGQAGEFLGDPVAFTEALQGKSALVIGPGMGNGPKQKAFLQAILPSIQLPTLLDADALNIIAAHPELWDLVPPGTVITPHPGEMKRLQASPDPISHRLEAAEALAKRRNVVVVLKGPGTIVACPDGTTWINTTGNPGMGTGGTGDVLAGMIGALLCLHPPGIAAAIGVFLHGLAGDLAAAAIGQQSMVAGDVLNEISEALMFVLKPNPLGNA
jgi:hydroxyethylthiazole kinase-like uncharacterized protein yjeF